MRHFIVALVGSLLLSGPALAVELPPDLQALRTRLADQMASWKTHRNQKIAVLDIQGIEREGKDEKTQLEQRLETLQNKKISNRDWSDYWAGEGRTNEYDGPDPIVVEGATQTPLAWEFLGTGSVYTNTSRLYNFSGVAATTFGSLQRGDVLSIGLATDGSNDVRDEDLSPEFIEVAQEGDFYEIGTGPGSPSPRVQEMPYNIKYPSIPLADVWRGRTMHSVRIYRGAAGGDTARHTIAYYPYVRGTYDLDVRVKQTAEVQELRTTVGKGRHLGGTFALQLTAVDKFGEVSTATTGDIPFDATNQ
mgnify:CR=1 FL=1